MKLVFRTDIYPVSVRNAFETEQLWFSGTILWLWFPGYFYRRVNSSSLS